MNHITLVPNILDHPKWRYHFKYVCIQDKKVLALFGYSLDGEERKRQMLGTKPGIVGIVCFHIPIGDSKQHCTCHILEKVELLRLFATHSLFWHGNLVVGEVGDENLP
jgi:hypothetical protein